MRKRIAKSRLHRSKLREEVRNAFLIGNYTLLAIFLEKDKRKLWKKKRQSH